MTGQGGRKPARSLFRRIIGAVLFAGLAALAVVAFLIADVTSYIYPTKSFAWNQRTIMQLDTPEGEVRFETVERVEVAYFGQTGGDALTGTEVRYRVEGQAAFVALPGGRVLFALRQGPGLAEGVYAVAEKNGRRERLRRIVAQAGEAPVPLERRLWPRFVAFEDLARPETVVILEPAAFETALGAGYRLRAVLFQITDLPVTRPDLQAVLPWFEPVQGGHDRLCPPDGKPNDLPDCMRVRLRDFSAEIDHGVK